MNLIMKGNNMASALIVQALQGLQVKSSVKTCDC